MNNAKCYSLLLKTLLNEEKIPCIPPIFYKNTYVNDFKEKSESFNSFC